MLQWRGQKGGGGVSGVEKGGGGCCAVNLACVLSLGGRKKNTHISKRECMYLRLCAYVCGEGGGNYCTILFMFCIEYGRRCSLAHSLTLTHSTLH